MLVIHLSISNILSILQDLMRCAEYSLQLLNVLILTVFSVFYELNPMVFLLQCTTRRYTVTVLQYVKCGYMSELYKSIKDPLLTLFLIL